MMQLSDFYPTPTDFIKNELAVLDYLANNTYIKQEHGQFSNDAHKYRAQYARPRRGFEFASFFNIYHKEWPRLRKRTARHFRRTPNALLGETPNLQIVIGGFVEQITESKYGNISYVMAVGRIRSLTAALGEKALAENQNPALMRKFHFDVTGSAGGKDRKQEHPMCHLQYCGKMNPRMLELGFRQAQLDHMFEKLSEPRIFFWPMSLALLVDMALHEFPDEKSARFRNDPRWKNIIRDNEHFLLAPFYEKCIATIRSASKHRNTLADEFYVL